MSHDEENRSVAVRCIEYPQNRRVVFLGGDPHPAHDQIAVLLSRSLESWIDKNPDKRIRATLPIAQKGTTIMIHVWYKLLP